MRLQGTIIFVTKRLRIMTCHLLTTTDADNQFTTHTIFLAHYLLNLSYSKLYKQKEYEFFKY